MNRFAVFLLSLVVGAPIFARVISYAPYTNRVALPAFQERTARHFVLLEAEPQDYMYSKAGSELVLYDSSGAEEPRVIRSGGFYAQAALYQKDGGTPVILALGQESSGRGIWVSDGGTAWQKVNIPGAYELGSVLDVDTGGPFANGLFTPIAIGNDTWPFVVTLRNNGVWAIGRNGAAQQIVNTSDARVVGRNATGDRFLIHSSNTLWIAGVHGSLVKAADAPRGAYTGWIASDGTAYVELLRYDGRYLFTTNGKSLQFVAGAYGSTAPTGLHIPPSLLVPLRFFAVPTHDYNGAWIIQRDTGRPTTLSRHTSATGLQTMWADAAGPQVEALIAGRSGQTVLVQVHREREGVELSNPFIDPALAVWRVGQPLPRVYEELYLREEWNKGFVIIDVDEIESGKPFVFNSGFKEVERPVSRVSAPIGGGGDVVQEWGVVRGSFKQRLVRPGVARVRGAYDSFWQTDLTVYNPTGDSQRVEVRFVPLGMEEAVTATLTLDPHEIRALPDVLKALFLLEEGGGTLHLLPDVGINAVARTYSRRADGGTYGFGMQAIDALNASGPRFSLSFAGAFQGPHFRTNLLLTDTSGRGTHAKLRAAAFSALPSGGDGVTAPAQSTVQVSAVDAAVGLHAGMTGALEVEPTRGAAIATVVAIDNRSNDPTYFPPDLPASVPRAIPVIGHLGGANGAQFRSDLYLYNPRDTSRTVALFAKSWDSPVRGIAFLTLFPREARVVPDALRTLFGMQGLARLRYASPEWQQGDAVRITSRTYTVDPSGATYGCLVPPLNGFQIGTSGDRLEILGVSAGPGFRTNVGLVDLSDTSPRDATVRLTVIDGGQRVVDTLTVRVPARGGMQLNDIFGSRGLIPPPAALLVVEILDGRQIAAYATVTDNRSNDSFYLGSQLGAQPGAD